jgi:demethylmenaquinone methyltransferase/2-methoxy-6-polyprenyl-1,4-benzoquinol methylase
MIARRRGAWEAVYLGADDTVLDMCTGTCDVAIEALRRTRVRRVIGVDFAAEMLRVGRTKLQKGGFSSRAALVRGDAMRIPVRDRSVDAVTIAFGIRNVLDPLSACREMQRVLAPGGKLAVLEFSMPTVPGVRSLYRWYFRHVLPRIGRVVSRHGDAYDYLPTSVGAFFTPGEFTTLLARAGFVDVRAVSLTLGVVYLYVAVRA